MTAFALLEPHERKVRRQWLVGLVVLAVITTLEMISEFSVTTLISLINLYLLYHCAYRNPGTVLLTFTITITILTFPRDMIEMCKNLGNDLREVELYLKIIFVVMFSGILFALGWWVKLCMDVRRINKQVRRRYVYACPEYQEALITIAQAETLDAMNRSFYRITGSQSREFVEAITLLYEKRKLELKNQTL